MTRSPRLPPRLPAVPGPRWLLATLALLSLTGCFDLLEEVWVYPDGSARMVLDITLPKSLVDLAKVTSQDPLAEARERARAAEARLKQNPDITHFEMRDYEEAGEFHLRYDLTVKDVSKLPELQRQAMEEASRDDRARVGGNWDFRIERTGIGEYVFVQRFDSDKAAAATGDDPANEATKELGRQMAKALLGGNHLTVRVHAPGFGETNGTLNEQKDTVEWKMSMAELMDGSSPRELRAVIYAGAPLWLWPLVIGVPVLVLALAVASARRRRRTAP